MKRENTFIMFLVLKYTASLKFSVSGLCVFL